MADKLLFFAEDALGGQFAIQDNEIYSFDPETGETSHTAQSIDEWVSNLLNDYEVITAYPLAHEWQTLNGSLKANMRLLPKIPFVLGGDYSASNLVAMDAVTGMRYRGDLAVQIRDLPEGATVNLRVVE